MTDDKEYDWDKQTQVGLGLGQKEHYYNYSRYWNKNGRHCGNRVSSGKTFAFL